MKRHEMDEVVERLLASEEPSVRFKVRVNVLGEDPDSSSIRALREEIRKSVRVRTLLQEQQADGTFPCHPYAKWYGAHWVVAVLADIGYPPGDDWLRPLVEQEYEWLLSTDHTRRHLMTIDGRVRRCGSQEGNALYSILMLGLADERADELAHRLIAWQWPDGGWNCDKRPEAVNSSFHETILPLRALSLHAQVKGNEASKAAAKRASEVFLKRRLFRKQHDGSVMHREFVALHYPCYWHYDIPCGLKVMAEAGFIGDDRCRDALDLLESKRLPDGGFPAEKRYYRVTEKRAAGREQVDWGGTSIRRLNEWVTADALFVLRAAGRL
jgi:hypothetical protein